MSQESLKEYFAEKLLKLEKDIHNLPQKPISSLRIEVENVGTWQLDLGGETIGDAEDFVWMSQEAAEHLVANPSSVLKSVKDRKMIVSRPEAMIVVFNQVFPGSLGIELPEETENAPTSEDVDRITSFFEVGLLEQLRTNKIETKVKRGVYVFEVEGAGVWSVSVGGDLEITRGESDPSVSKFTLSARAAADAIKDPKAIFGIFSAGDIRVTNPCRAVRFIEQAFTGSITDHLPAETIKGLFPEKYRKTEISEPDEIAPSEGTGRTYFFNGDEPYPVHYDIVGEDALIEGDIEIGTVAEMELVRAVIEDGAPTPLTSIRIIDSSDKDKYVWPNGTVPYVVETKNVSEARIKTAVDHWNSKTNINLIKRTTETNYVAFIDSADRNSSSVGMQTGCQTIKLKPDVSNGTIIHEIGHAIGLHHEQKRIDRDSYVDIIWDNIKDNKKGNFEIETTSTAQDLEGYDYGSIMHYHRKAFSKNGEDTIVPTDSKAEIGQRSALSETDISAVNSFC